MAIKGSLKEASLPDVLQLLAMGQKTGCLAVTDRSNFGYIYFDRGRITYASIVNRRDRLGDLLVKNQMIRPDQLSAAIDEQVRSPGRKLGQILIAHAAITPEQLEQYIRLQIEEAVYYLFTWSQGTFYFEADERPEEGAMLVSINPENLLLEGARRIDEWSLIEKKIPSLDLVFRLEGDLRELELTDEQRKLIPLIDGKRSVQETIDESGMVEFDVGKALFGLIQAGLLHPVGRQKTAEMREVPRVRIDEHRNLGVAFYKTAMYDEASREFRRVVELEPTNVEARFFMGLVALRLADDRGAMQFFRETIDVGGPRAAAFHGIALALERMGLNDDALLASGEAVRLNGKKPAFALSRAILLLKTGDPRGAHAAFAAYRTLLGKGRAPAAFYTFATLAAAAAGQTDEAVQLAAEGLGLFPHAAMLLLALGNVRERKGEWETAEGLYRKATEENPELPQAHKSLADALYRRGVYEEAATAYERAVELAPAMGDDMYFKLGNIHYKRMRRQQAVELWRKALELNPENGVVRTNLELVEKVL